MPSYKFILSLIIILLPAPPNAGFFFMELFLNQEDALKKFAQALGELVAAANLEDGMYRQTVILDKKGMNMDVLSFELDEAKQDEQRVSDSNEDGDEARRLIVEP